MYGYKYILFGIILNSSIICGQFSKKGIFTFGAITGNDVPKLWSKYQSSISYIPTISFKKNVSNQSLLDFELVYKSRPLNYLPKNKDFGLDVKIRIVLLMKK